MSQLPNAFYNPTASPVSTSVVPFVQPPQPVQVEIGGGIQNLGAAFSGFSQTLASFVANRVSQNRADAIKEGELKALKSRKSFQQMVADKEIDPIENPWEALGAAGADGQLKAHSAISRWQAEYQTKMESDPNFASSMGSFESFINERISNEMAVGLDNPVWQRSFLQEVNPRVSYMAENHGQNVVKYRREKMTDGLAVSVMAAVADAKQVKGDNYDARSSEIAKIFEGVVPKYEELSQTIGSEEANKVMVAAVIKARVASGDDPAVVAALSRIKSGTGPLMETKQAKAMSEAAAQTIEAARDDRDREMLGKFYLDTIGKTGVPPDEDAFETYAMTQVRPGMPRADVMTYYQKVHDGAKQTVHRLMTNEVDNIMESMAQYSLAAYTLDKNGRLPTDPESMVMRSPTQLKALLQGRMAEVYRKYKTEISESDLNARVNTLIQDLRYIGAQQVAQANSKTDMANPQRAVAVVDYSINANAEMFEAPVIMGNLQEFLASPASDYNNYVAYGLNVYRAARLRGGAPAMEKLGFTKEAVKFYELMDAAATSGKNLEDSAKSAASRISYLSMLPASRDNLTIAGTVVRDRTNTWFPYRTSAQVEKAAPVLELFAGNHASVLLSQYPHMTDETLKHELGKYVERQLTVLDNGAPFVRPDEPIAELNDDRLVFGYTESLTDSLKKADDGALETAYLEYNPRTNQYAVMVVPVGGTFLDSKTPSTKQLEQLKKDGHGFVFTPNTLKSVLINWSIGKYQSSAATARQNAKAAAIARGLVGGS
jgi:hypothetical protein